MAFRRDRAYEIDMCQGGDSAKNAAISAADVLQHFTALFNAADVIVVGRFAGDNSLAAVGSNTSLINLVGQSIHWFVCGGEYSGGPVLRS